MCVCVWMWTIRAGRLSDKLGVIDERKHTAGQSAVYCSVIRLEPASYMCIGAWPRDETDGSVAITFE